MSNLTVSSLKESGFYLAKERVRNASELIDMLHYLDFLAQNNGIDVGALELPVTEEHEFKLTRSQVTALFFDHIEGRKEESKDKPFANPVPIPEEEVENIRRLLSAAAEKAKRTMLASADSLRDQARPFAETYEAKLKEAAKIHRRVRLMSSATPDEQLDRLVNGLHKTNWDWYRRDEDTLEFVSRTDVMLIEKNPDAGIDFELNCGKFRAAISDGDMSLYVFPHKDCISPSYGEGRNIHPNISREGNVCFGTAKIAAEDARMSGDILKLLEILDALLPNCGSPPFVELHAFAENIKKRDERLRRMREQKEKRPQEATGEFGDEDTFEDDAGEFVSDDEENEEHFCDEENEDGDVDE